MPSARDALGSAVTGYLRLSQIYVGSSKGQPARWSYVRKIPDLIDLRLK